MSFVLEIVAKCLGCSGLTKPGWVFGTLGRKIRRKPTSTQKVSTRPWQQNTQPFPTPLLLCGVHISTILSISICESIFVILSILSLALWYNNLSFSDFLVVQTLFKPMLRVNVLWIFYQQVRPHHKQFSVERPWGYPANAGYFTYHRTSQHCDRLIFFSGPRFGVKLSKTYMHNVLVDDVGACPSITTVLFLGRRKQEMPNEHVMQKCNEYHWSRSSTSTVSAVIVYYPIIHARILSIVLTGTMPILAATVLMPGLHPKASLRLVKWCTGHAKLILQMYPNAAKPSVLSA